MRPTANTPRRLLIVSHVRHYAYDGKLHAYGPYGREIDIWADLFPEVTVVAPFCEGPPPGDWLPLTRRNITVRPIRETGGETISAKLHQIACLPALVATLSRAMIAADAVHVRCPGNVGLLGAAIAPLVGRPRIAKYAGQWNGYAGEPWTVSLQRRLLRSWWGAPVTVYGVWPNQPPHIIPFFTSMMTDEQVRTAVRVAERKALSTPVHVLFAGRLVPEKRVGALIEAAKLAVDAGVRLELTVLGDGPERGRLKEQAERLGISRHVKFLGAVAFDAALEWYDWAHCLVLPSEHSEGWPKVIAEAMCHGVLCIGVDHGQLSAMLSGRGVLLETGSPRAIAGALEAVATRPNEFTPRMQAASQWARQYSLERLRAALADLLSRQWQVPVSARELPAT